MRDQPSQLQATTLLINHLDKRLLQLDLQRIIAWQIVCHLPVQLDSDKHLQLFMSAFRFQKKYFILTLLLFVTEVLIALYMNDDFVRPYVGDFLVVILLYCFLKSFLPIRTLTLAIVVLVFAYTLEVAQYFQLANHLGLPDRSIFRIIIGSSFEWSDMLAYTLGIILVLCIEK
jgi:hypothetical protein